jgi:hypothetical protein
MIVSNEEPADAGSGLGLDLEHELQAVALERMRRREARIELRRVFAARRANGLIDRQAARAARVSRAARDRSTSGSRSPAEVRTELEPDP